MKFLCFDEDDDGDDKDDVDDDYNDNTAQSVV
jgi:hypothetical protein